MSLTSLLMMTGLGLAFSDTQAPAQPDYAVARTDAAHVALLTATPDAWAPATRIEWGSAPYATEFRALWTPRGLYLRFDARDIDPWHTMTRRDDKIWNEEVVEIFIDPAGQRHHYAELEISPANVVCDLRMVSGVPDIKGELEWHFAGLETRVTPLPRPEVGGDEAGGPSDRAAASYPATADSAAGDQPGAAPAAFPKGGWIATAFLPWEDFRSLPTPDSVGLPPKAGDRWRFNVFRIKRPHGPSRPNDDVIYAAWSKPPGPSFHVPAVFREMIFR